MRVLDVGSGAGDVAFLAADMVGDTGEVVGVDRVPAVLEDWNWNDDQTDQMDRTGIQVRCSGGVVAKHTGALAGNFSEDQGACFLT